MNYLEGSDINVKEAIENKNYINLTKKVEIKVSLSIKNYRKPTCQRICRVAVSKKSQTQLRST